jgi:transcriptional regulator with XRE-family HTH domain
MNGHIAAALREYMTQHNLSPGDFNQMLGYERGNTGVYQWLRAKAAPGDKLRTKLHKVTGIPLDTLTPRDVDTPTQVTTAEPRAVSTILRPMSPNPVLQFTVSADGTARIKLDAAMSLAAASPLLRILLDAGIVPSTQGDDDGQA